MGQIKPHPRYEVVSMRVSYEEKEAIEQFIDRAGMSISDALREAAQQAGMFKGGMN